MLFRRQDRPAPSPSPECVELMLDGEALRVHVRRNAQARRLTLRVRAATRDVALTAPPHVSLKTAAAFVQRQTEWIRARLVRLPETVPFADGATIPLRGDPHRIVHRPGSRGTVWLETGDDGAQRICVAGEEPYISRRITDFLKQQAKADLVPAVRRHAAALGVQVGRITLRDTASRWGSCSSDGNLSFSWRLIFAPPSVLDYLAAHEVSHRLEMNHGPHYWRVLEQIYPERRSAEAWLRAFGAGLHRYGA